MVNVPVLNSTDTPYIRAKSVCEKCDTEPTMMTDIDETCHAHTVGEAGGYSEVRCRLLPRPTLASRPGTLRPVARHRRDARTTATRTCWTRYSTPSWRAALTGNETLYTWSGPKIFFKCMTCAPAPVCHTLEKYYCARAPGPECHTFGKYCRACAPVPERHTSENIIVPVHPGPRVIHLKNIVGPDHV